MVVARGRDPACPRVREPQVWGPLAPGRCRFGGPRESSLQPLQRRWPSLMARPVPLPGPGSCRRPAVGRTPAWDCSVCVFSGSLRVCDR